MVADEVQILSDSPNYAEVQALRDACEELAEDIHTLATLIHSLRTALVPVGLVKGGRRPTT